MNTGLGKLVDFVEASPRRFGLTLGTFVMVQAALLFVAVAPGYAARPARYTTSYRLGFRPCRKPHPVLLRRRCATLRPRFGFTAAS